MKSLLKNITILVIITIVAISGIGCGGGSNPISGDGGSNTFSDDDDGSNSISGGGELTVGNISGDAVVDEKTTTNFAISASGDTGVTYQWTVTPAAAGTLTGANTESATFMAADVITDTTAVIQVEVNSDNGGPVVSTLNITISYVEVIVTFPGPVLDSIIREMINKPSADIYDFDLLGILEIDNYCTFNYIVSGGPRISNLEGIEFCTNLQNLDLHLNDVSDIYPLVVLSEYGNLARVDLTYNILSETSENVYIPQLEANGVIVEWGMGG